VTDDRSNRHAELAVQARLGSQPAFDELMRETKQPLYRFIRRYIGDDDDAYDVLQETFISAWGALKGYDEKRPFLTWLRAIALNKCRDFGRRRAVRDRLQTLLSWILPTHQDPGPAGGEEDARLHQLDLAIAALPAFYKEPLLLTAIAGLSHRQAALELATTPKAIELRVRRARQQLHKDMGPEPAEPE